MVVMLFLQDNLHTEKCIDLNGWLRVLSAVRTSGITILNRTGDISITLNGPPPPASLCPLTTETSDASSWKYINGPTQYVWLCVWLPWLSVTLRDVFIERPRRFFHIILCVISSLVFIAK